MFDVHTHQELQQSVRSINIIDNFIHVLYRSLAELLHHKKNIDQQSTKDLQKREEGTFMCITSVIQRSAASFLIQHEHKLVSACACYLQ